MALSEHIEEFSQRLIFCFGVKKFESVKCRAGWLDKIINEKSLDSFPIFRVTGLSSLLTEHVGKLVIRL